MKTMQEVLVAAFKLKDDELKDVARTLWDEVKNRSRRSSMTAAIEFSPGDEVEHTEHSRRLPMGTVGKVVRRSGANLLVDFGPFRTWRVSGNVVRKVEKKKARAAR